MIETSLFDRPNGPNFIVGGLSLAPKYIYIYISLKNNDDDDDDEGER